MRNRNYGHGNLILYKRNPTNINIIQILYKTEKRQQEMIINSRTYLIVLNPDLRVSRCEIGSNTM